MESFDGAEICEIVGIYLLKNLSPLSGKENFGLYRDDGLATVNSSSGPVLDGMRKDIISIFKNEVLSITIETNLIETDFLDVTFNLLTGKYFPFGKVNNKPSYVNAKSNHPHTIIKELPKMINKRLSELSCNQEEFNKAKPLYEEALSESYYKASLKFEKPQYNTKRNRLRKVIWFNPPFSQNVKTNIGKTFLKLVKQHFPKHHKLNKIFNKNTLKLSYCYMKNMSSIIKQHNVKILSAESNEKRSCNCRNKECCPLEGHCLRECMVYEAKVSTDNNFKLYYDTWEGEIKSRFYNHTKSFRDRGNETELSKYIWQLRDESKSYNIHWNIFMYATPYKCGTRRCDLCLTEKYIIARADQEHLLNKRTEIISKCHHRNKYLIKYVK